MRWFIYIMLVGLTACSATSYEITGDEIKQPLTQKAGDARQGQLLFINREQGHCILCHRVSSLDAPFQGNLGPALDGIDSRLSASQLRLRIVDYDAFRAGTTMPSYFRKHNLHQVAKTHADKTVLSAQDIEDIIAYLQTLKETG